MSKQSLTNGYYGKVPTHGDFVSRGLPTSFIDPWDAWLQEAVITSRQQLGDDWLNCYLTGPIYRFVLAPGVCGENGWLGIMMPSVDKVGRYYPMTITTMNRLNMNPLIALQQETAWFTGVETLALSSLDDDFSLEQFNIEINELRAELLINNNQLLTPSEQINQQISHHAWQRVMAPNQSIGDVMPCFLDTVLKEHYFAYSVWWTQGSEQVASSVLMCAGLPPFDGVAAMFDGDWQKWGWDGNRYPI